MSIRRKMSLLAVFAVVILLTAAHAQSDRRRSTSRGPGVPEKVAVTPTAGDFSTKQLEHYIGDEALAHLRPGLTITVESITIPADRKPVVEIRVTDGFNNPIDRLGQLTPGSVSISFVLSRYDPEIREYIPYTVRTQTSPNGASAVQASADSGGTWTSLELGRYQYKFRTTLPSDYPASMTHSLGIYASRSINEFDIDKTYYDNVVKDFVPAGGQVMTMWDKINDQSCNNCHEQLAFHGGSRREVKLCVLCHTEGGVDPDSGNSIDMEIMIHKIHMGANLPSVQAGQPYQIIGFRQSVHDFSDVHFPQDIRNCANCHRGREGQTPPSQHQLWFTEPSVDACGSCHDDVDFVTGENHPAGPVQDGTCATCHQPDGPEFGPSIMGAHTIPEKSKQLEGLHYMIVDVTGVAPGSKPTAVFRITNDEGDVIDGTTLNRFGPRYAGPTTDYTTLSSGGTAMFDPATGLTSYTFRDALPESASGTWAFSADVYRFVNIQQPGGEAPIRVREAAFNNVKYAAVDGSPMARREVAAIQNCNVCHDMLALHGGQRKNVEDCILCHNPTATDAARRPADQMPARSVNFKFMIHRIHAGAELTRDFTVYGFGGSAHNYNDLHYPGNLANCDKCHVSDSQQLPLPHTAAPVVTPREFYSPLGPAAAACLGCHDSKDAAAHAFLQTTTFPGTTDPAEACGVCHGPGADWSVDRVHAD